MVNIKHIENEHFHCEHLVKSTSVRTRFNHDYTIRADRCSRFQVDVFSPQMSMSASLAVTTVSSAKVALIQRAPFAVSGKPAVALGMSSKTTTLAKVTIQEHGSNYNKKTHLNRFYLKTRPI